MTRIFFITHTPGKNHRAMRVFPPSPHRTHLVPQPGMQFSGHITTPDHSVPETPHDTRGTGTPNTPMSAPKQEAAGLPADAPAEDDWIYDLETPR